MMHLKKIAGIAVFVLLALMLGCGTPEKSAPDQAPAQLHAPETFAWSTQAVEFAPPPSTWRRRQYVFNGKQGVQFLLNKSLDGAITISEFSAEAVQVILEKKRRRNARLADVLHLVQLDPQKYSDSDKFHYQGEAEINIAGSAGKQVDYIFDTSMGPKFWREIYVLRNNHLYVAAYEGPEKNLELFERVVATIDFPASHAR